MQETGKKAHETARGVCSLGSTGKTAHETARGVCGLGSTCTHETAHETARVVRSTIVRNDILSMSINMNLEGTTLLKIYNDAIAASVCDEFDSASEQCKQIRPAGTDAAMVLLRGPHAM